MLAAKPIGPRNKSSKPILTLPLSTSTPQAPETQAQSSEETNFTLSDQLSTATTSHFTPMVPRLNIPRRPLKPGLGPLQINVSVYDRERTEERTIQPEQTLSPERIHQRPRQQGVSSRKSSGDLPLVLPPLPRRDSLHDLRDALNQVANASHPVTGSGNSSFSTSPKSITNTSPEADGNNDNQAQTSTSRSLEFSDEYLEVLSRLGEGAGGAVHKVRDTRDGAIYARKTITTREVAMRQVVRELNIISTTSHVNIVQCFGAYMTPSSSEVKIVMEHCEAGSLEAVGMKIKEANAVVGEKIAGRIAEGVLQGLAYLHSKRTIHRDIKPSNILLSRDGVVKLSDFGVSGELVNSMVGTFTGTLLYMAPERVTGSEYSVRSDVWSTGISILELVQNRFPFPSDVPTIELIVTITKGEPPQLEDDPDAGIFWGDKMKDFIRQTLICDPQKRPTPREMLSHPWITDVMAQEDHMARWIRQVWGWPKPRKNTGLKDTMDQSEKSI